MTSLLSQKPSEKIILALDGMTKVEAFELISQIPELCWVKVGLELFVKSGPELITALREAGKRVFLDLKFHDIPTTMSEACRQAARTGAELITVHACAGRKALSEANNAAILGAKDLDFPPPKLLAVTVLTSWSSSDFAHDLGIQQSLYERVQSMAELAFTTGIGGCVCSPLEVKALRHSYPEPFELITPGIRLPGEALHDQERVMTPSSALRAGASKLVIGRSITRSVNPSEAFQKYCEELKCF